MAAKSLIGADVLPNFGLTISSEDPEYPALNGHNRNPADPMKSTSTSATITGGSPGTLEGFAIINHNLTTATLTMGAFSGPVNIPPRLADGQSVGAWVDLRGLGASGGWSLSAASVGNVAIGEVVGVQTLIEVFWRDDGSLTFEETWPHDEITTFYQSKIKYEKGIRIRRATGTCMRDADRDGLRSVALATKGGLYPFLLIPEQDKNDALYVYRTNPYNFSPTGPRSSNMTLEVEEASSSLTL